MTDIPINAKVECKTTNVIFNPVTEKVTHLVVEDKGLPDKATRIVPFSQVVDATRDCISLNCNKADVVIMPPFIKAQLMGCA